MENAASSPNRLGFTSRAPRAGSQKIKQRRSRGELPQIPVSALSQLPVLLPAVLGGLSLPFPRNEEQPFPRVTPPHCTALPRDLPRGPARNFQWEKEFKDSFSSSRCPEGTGFSQRIGKAKLRANLEGARLRLEPNIWGWMHIWGAGMGARPAGEARGVSLPLEKPGEGGRGAQRALPAERLQREAGSRSGSGSQPERASHPVIYRDEPALRREKPCLSRENRDRGRVCPVSLR